MTDLNPSIELNLAEQLRDSEYRQEFFLAESSSLIAKQLIELRKRRGLTQAELATLCDTGQPAISRVERADYQGWSYRMLRKLAQKLDARLRVYIEAAEDVIGEYQQESTTDLVNLPAGAAELDTHSQLLFPGTIPHHGSKTAAQEPVSEKYVQKRSGREYLEQRPWN
jgi:transcriptional regulator with XRE-family HTH domain